MPSTTVSFADEPYASILAAIDAADRLSAHLAADPSAAPPTLAADIGDLRGRLVRDLGDALVAAADPDPVSARRRPTGVLLPACDPCVRGDHPACDGDFTNHCGCLVCYPPEGIPR